MTGSTTNNNHPGAALSTAWVNVSDIGIIPEWQVRGRLDEAKIAKCRAGYAGGAAMPPVRLANVKGGLFLLDGSHRMAALKELGRSSVEVTIQYLTAKEAEYQAAQANRSHGKHLAPAEHRVAFRKFIATKQHRLPGSKIMSLRQMEKAFGGVSYVTLRKWLAEDYPRIASQVSAKGSVGYQPQPPAMDDPAAEHRAEDERLFALAAAAMEQAVAVSRGISSPSLRVKLAGIATATAQAIEEPGAYALVPPPTFKELFPDPY